MAKNRAGFRGDRARGGVARDFLVVMALALGSFVFGFWVIAPMLPKAKQPETTSAATAPDSPPASSPTPAPPPPPPPSSSTAPNPTIEPAQETPPPQKPDSPDAQTDAAAPVTRNPEPEAPRHRREPFASPNADSPDRSDRSDRPSRADRARADTGAATSESPAPDAGAQTDPPASDSRLYRVQIGVYSRRKDADLQAESARAKGFDSRVVPYTASDGRSMFRVQCGVFQDEAHARAVQQSLNDAGIESFVSR